MLEVGQDVGGRGDIGDHERGGDVGEGDSVGEGEGGASVIRGRVPLEGGCEGYELHHSWVQWHCGGSCMLKESKVGEIRGGLQQNGSLTLIGTAHQLAHTSRQLMSIVHCTHVVNLRTLRAAPHSKSAGPVTIECNHRHPLNTALSDPPAGAIPQPNSSAIPFFSLAHRSGRQHLLPRPQADRGRSFGPHLCVVVHTK